MKKWTLALSALLLIFAVACNQNPNKFSIKGENISDQRALNVSITAQEDDLITFTPSSAASARTIIAESFVLNGTDGEQLFFYIFGQSVSGVVQEPKEVTVTSDDGITGKVIIDIDCLNWDLTLAATTTQGLTSVDDVMNDAVLIGYANVDMQFTNVIKFTLAPDGLTRSGGVDLGISLENDWEIPEGYEAKASIVNKKDGSVISNAEATELVKALYSTDGSTNCFANPATTENRFTFDNIAPGTYTFRVDFTKENERKSFHYTDTIIILPGRTIEKNIIIPKKVQDKPSAPTTLQLTYDENSEDAVYDGFYSATLTWEDTSNNENNFAIDILELADDADPTAADAWEDEGNILYKYNFANDIRSGEPHFYKAGSLLANNESISLYFELGKRYLIRIYAENEFLSDPLVLGETVNRYRLSYYLQGGSWEDGSGPKFVEKINEYYTQTAAPGITIKAPSGVQTGTTTTGTAETPWLYMGEVNNAVTWYYWVTDLSANTKYDTTIGYEGFKNLNLYAVYARDGEVEIYDNSDYDILDGWITSSMFATASKDSTISYERGSDTEVTLTLSPADVTWKYDNVSLAILYSGKTYFYQEQVGSQTGNTFTISVDNLQAGRVYNFILSANYNHTHVSYPLSINILD